MFVFMAKQRKKKKNKSGYRPKTRITSFPEAYRRVIDLLRKPDRRRLFRKAQARFENYAELKDLPRFLTPYFLDWAAFDFRDKKDSLTVAEHFVEEHSELDKPTRERILSLVHNAHPGFFKVTRRNEDKTYIVQELGAEIPGGYLVHADREEPPEGSIVEGRLVPWEDHWVFSSFVELSKVPQIDVEKIEPGLRQIRQKYTPDEWRSFAVHFRPSFQGTLIQGRNVAEFVEFTAEGPEAVEEDLEFQSILTLFDRGNTDEAKAAAEKLLARTPGHRSAASLLSQIYEQEGNSSKARGVLEHALRLNPDDVELRMELAEQQAASGQFDLAAQTAEPIKDRSDLPLYNAIRTSYASYLYKCGQVEQAKAIFLSVLQNEPENARCVQRIAQTFVSEQEYKEAEDAIVKHLEVVEQTTSRIYQILGTCHYFERDWAQALAAFDRIPESARTPLDLASMGESAFQLERLTQARRIYQQLLDMEEDISANARSIALQRVAFIEWRRGMHERALPLLHQAREIDPDKPNILWLLAEVYTERRELDVARSCVALMLERFPDHPLLPALVIRLFPEILRRTRTLPPYGARRARRRFRHRRRGGV